MKLWLVILLIALNLSANAQNEKRAAKIAALYMYNFFTLTEAPGRYASDQKDISLLFLCSDDFSKNAENHWKKKFEGKDVDGLPLSTLSSNKISDVKKADMVLVSSDCKIKVKDVKKAIGKKPILLVGYKLAFGEPMINFIFQGNKLKFSLNKKYLAKNDIEIADKLGALAVNEINSEKEWDNVLDKLSFELENNKGGTVNINSDDLDELLKEYDRKQDELSEIEEDLIFKDVSLRQKDQQIAYKDSLSREKEIELIEQEQKLVQLNKDVDDKQQQIGEQADTISNQKTIIFFSIFVGILILGGGVVIYRSYRDKKRANEKLAEQKRIVEEKNQEITDSINYAKRIQAAILPPPRMFEKYLPSFFVLYEPKDIVAGDFYWLESVYDEKSKEDVTLFAAADCTGHGVPGAMVSVICNNGLNRSVHEHHLQSPGEILDKTREIVIREFEKSEEEVKDGMDIALCSISAKERADGTFLLKYAGAMNPLWIIRKGGTEIEEIKANKQPIGRFDQSSPYDTHEITVKKGDTIYVFSDGYADQFGGAKGKKFKPKNLKNLLLKIQDQSLREQEASLLREFNDWKGGIEQLDDVCVMGVRV